MIDPIDGTKNFVRGVPIWATLIALMEGDQPVVGLVSAPALGRRWWAATGHGAYAGPAPRPPTPIRVSGVEPARRRQLLLLVAARLGADAAGSTRCSTSCGTAWRSRAYGDFYGYMLLAEGAVDVMVEPELSLWDVAALVPIVTEAGGTFTDLSAAGPRRRAAAARWPPTASCTRTSSTCSTGLTTGRWPDALTRRGNRLSSPVVSSGWLFLAAMIVAYGVANLLQSVAAARTDGAPHLRSRACCCGSPGTAPTWSGSVCQFAGFVLAFLARRDLPLFLVQASVAAGLGVTALLGVLVLKWRLPRGRGGAARAALRRDHRAGAVGAAGAVPAARDGRGVALGVALVLIGVLGFFAARLHGAPGSVALGSLAGLAFSARPRSAPGRWPRRTRCDGVRHQPAALPADRPLGGRAAPARAGDAARLDDRGGGRDGRRRGGARGRSSACCCSATGSGRGASGWPRSGSWSRSAAVIGLTRYAEPQHHHEVAGRP